MATATINAYVSAALDLVNSTGLYLALGRTTPWENEQLPPVTEEGINQLEELVGFKRMSRVSICRPLLEGETTNLPTVEYKGNTWFLIDNANAYEEEAYYVYMEATVSETDLPPSEYRQVGVYTNVPWEAVTAPVEEGAKGTLYYYDNRERFNRTEDVTVTEKFILNLKGNE